MMLTGGSTLIVIAGVEGGGVTLYGENRGDGTWRFRRSSADQTPLMLDEPAIERSSGWMKSWEEALGDLEAQGWHELPAVHVHPEFRARVWQALQERLGDPTDRRGACSLVHRLERSRP
jgi:hypothetical protein